MIERHLIMTDDPVIKVRDVQCPVGPQDDIDRPKPRVVAGEKIRFLNRFIGSAIAANVEQVYAAKDDVAEKHRALILLRKLIGCVINQAAECRRALVFVDHVRSKTETVVRLSEAGVGRPAEKLSDRLGMAASGVDVSERVERHAEWIYLPASENLD